MIDISALGHGDEAAETDVVAAIREHLVERLEDLMAKLQGFPIVSDARGPVPRSSARPARRPLPRDQAVPLRKVHAKSAHVFPRWHVVAHGHTLENSGFLVESGPGRANDAPRPSPASGSTIHSGEAEQEGALRRRETPWLKVPRNMQGMTPGSGPKFASSTSLGIEVMGSERSG